GKERAALHGHRDALFTTAFDPNGKFLASGSMDRTVRLWQMPGGKHVHTFEGHRGWVLDLAFSPDGKKLLSGSLDTTGLVWKMPPLPPPQRPNPPPAELAKLWDHLASADAKAAYQALVALAAAPRQAVPFLAEKLKPALAPDPKRVAQLIAELDNKNFAARQN